MLYVDKQEFQNEECLGFYTKIPSIQNLFTRYFSITKNNISYINKFHSLKCWNEIKKLIPQENIKVTKKAKAFLFYLYEKEKEKNKLLENAKKFIPTNILGFNGELYDYQKRDLGFLLKMCNISNYRHYIGNDMGTGKTILAISYMLALAEKNYKLTNKYKPIQFIIVCPSIAGTLPLQWKSEIEKFTHLKTIIGRELNIKIISNKNDFNNADGFIMSYRSMTTNKDILKELVKKSLLIFDESHALIHLSQRTKAALEISKQARGVICMSGTPFDARVSDLYYQLAVLGYAKTIAPNKNAFRNTFANWYPGKFGPIEKNAKDDRLPFLRYKMRHFYIRTSNEVCNLPGIHRVSIDVKLSNEDEYKEAEANVISWLIEQKGLPAAKRALRAEKLAQLSVLMNLATIGKEKAVSSFIENVLANNKKFVCFSKRIEILQRLYEKFKNENVGILLGGNKKLYKDHLSNFQLGKRQGLLVSTDAGGKGLNLQNAYIGIFINQPYKPGVKIQAEARMWRKGQQNRVLIYNFIGRDTLDLKMMKILDKRIKSLRVFFDEKKEDLFGDITDELFDLLLEHKNENNIQKRKNKSR